MINNILNYILIALLVLVGGYAIKTKVVNVKVSSENEDLNRAVSAYEQILEVLPFNVLASERKDKANDEINATLNSDNTILDGTYRM